MKFFAAILFSLAMICQSQTVSLGWSASDSGGVINYRIYFGTNSGIYPFTADVGLDTRHTVELPKTGRWYFVGTAIDSNGIESKFSNEVQFDAKPNAPTIHGETWVAITPVIEYSTNLVRWETTTGQAAWFPATNAQGFFTTRGLLIERVQLAN